MYFRNLIKIEKVYYYSRYSCTSIISGDLNSHYRTNSYFTCLNNKDKKIQTDCIYNNTAYFNIINGIKPEVGEIYTLVNMNKSIVKKSKFSRLINFLKRNNK